MTIKSVIVFFVEPSLNKNYVILLINILVVYNSIKAITI